MRKKLEQLSEALAVGGFDVRDLVFENVASEREVESFEKELGHALPAALRHLFLHVSSHVDFCWFAPEGREFPEPMNGCFSGALHWSFDIIRRVEEVKAAWIPDLFPNPDDEYDRVWHEKLAFHDVGNGDYLALDLDEASRGAVVYLSHDDGEGHGQVLAEDMIDLLWRWIPLACVGGEDWQWMPFLSSDDGYLDPYGDQAVSWRQELGLPAYWGWGEESEMRA